jgi:hypothetical protein
MSVSVDPQVALAKQSIKITGETGGQQVILVTGYYAFKRRQVMRNYYGFPIKWLIQLFG